MSITLPRCCAHADNALDPVISANTLSFHYGKRHKALCGTTSTKLIAGTPLEGQPLEAINQGVRRQGRQGRHLQQLRAGVEPHLLLEQP